MSKSSQEKQRELVVSRIDGWIDADVWILAKDDHINVF
jgi:hypothetical protein